MSAVRLGLGGWVSLYLGFTVVKPRLPYLQIPSAKGLSLNPQVGRLETAVGHQDIIPALSTALPTEV